MAASSSSERELQEELKDAGDRLLMPPSSVYELLSLLDKVEHLLSKVEQAPSISMKDALQPVMKALVAQEQLRHSDVDVKISVASCIHEITRITAPDAPYDDEQMKEIFKLTVMALEKLSLDSGRCYTKAVSILDTMAKVRSCLVMLDLECDELIIELFQLFLNIIRSDHPHSVFLHMEAIMTLVIDEIEEIPLELLIPLLTSMKKENQNVLPLSCELGENVLKKCAAKLKPCLPQGVQFMGIDLKDFAEIVSSICQDASGREYLVAKELAPDAVCPGGAGPSIDRSSRSVMNDGTTQMRGTYTSGDEHSLKTLERCQGKSTDARSNAHPGYLDSTKAVNLEMDPESVPKRTGRRSNSLIKPEEGYDHSSPDGSHRKRGRPKKKGNLINQGGLDLLSVLKGDNPQEKASQSTDATSMKESEITRDLKVKAGKGSRKKAVASKTKVQTTPAPGNFVVKEEDLVHCDPEGKQMDDKKPNRGNTTSGKHATKESSGKKIVPFSASRSLNKDESQLEEASKTKCKRKRSPWKEEVSEMPPDIKIYGEELVGCGIKVWWPLDETFYEGAVCSFDPIEKKHTVLYADGDEEILDLSKERWVLARENNFPEQGRETDVPSSDAFSDMPQKKKTKTKSESSTKKENVVSSSKSGEASASKSEVEGPICSSKSTDGFTLDPLCLVDKAKGDSDTSETWAKLKDEEKKSDSKSETATCKTIKRSKCDNSQISMGDNAQAVSESRAVDTAKQKNIPSPEVLSRHLGKKKLPDGARESEMES